jgi:hypothetical protein
MSDDKSSNYKNFKRLEGGSIPSSLTQISQINSSLRKCCLNNFSCTVQKPQRSNSEALLQRREISNELTCVYVQEQNIEPITSSYSLTAISY